MEMVIVYVCLCLFMVVSYFKRCLFADVKLGLVVSMEKQMSDGKEVDIVNC